MGVAFVVGPRSAAKIAPGSGRTVAGHDDHQGLCGRHDAADRMGGQLLNHARHRRGELLKFGALLGFRQVCRQTGGLPLGLRQFAEQSSAIFAHRLRTCFNDGGNRGLRFFEMAFLDQPFLLALGQLLQHLEILQP